MNSKTEKIINGVRIDPIIFTFRFNCRCNGECCHYGVYADLNEHTIILNEEKRICDLMDDSQTTDISRWFEKPEVDEDFESGVAVGTELFNNKCVFLNKNGLCVLQTMALNEGQHKWKYKPLYCILFPLTIYENSLTIDDEHIDRLKTCNKNPDSETSIFEFCKDELLHFFGKEGFAELEEYRKEYLNNYFLEKTDGS